MQERVDLEIPPPFCLTRKPVLALTRRHTWIVFQLLKCRYCSTIA